MLGRWQEAIPSECTGVFHTEVFHTHTAAYLREDRNQQCKRYDPLRVKLPTLWSGSHPPEKVKWKCLIFHLSKCTNDSGGGSSFLRAGMGPSWGWHWDVWPFTPKNRHRPSHCCTSVSVKWRGGEEFHKQLSSQSLLVSTNKLGIFACYLEKDIFLYIYLYSIFTVKG